MADNMSLADQAVETLAAVRAMDADMTNDRADRHMVRAMKRMAEAAIAEGLRRAAECVWLAKDLPTLVDGVRLRTAKEIAEMQPVDVERA